MHRTGARMNRGYIKLYRQSLATAVWDDAELFKLWTLCLLLANHKPAWVTVEGQREPVRVEAGQFITGCYSLHEHYYPKKKHKKVTQKSPRTLWRWMKMLEKAQYLSIETNRHFSIVTIANWRTYQIDELPIIQSDVKPMTNQCQTDVNPMSTNKNELRMIKNEQEDLCVNAFDSAINVSEIEADLAERRRLRQKFNL